MAKKFLVGAVIVLLTAAIFSVAAAKTDGVWRLDGSSSDELRNFRLTADDWHVDARGKEPTRAGLAELHASAGAQPSERALTAICEKISAVAPDAKIFVVDLRQESHGFANAIPVSWWVKHNAANAGKTAAEVEATEIELLKNLRGVETKFEPLGNDDKQKFKPVTIVPRVLQTENEVCVNVGVEYKRFAAADMQFPAPEVVDDFIYFVANLPENSWLHFHCHAGHGRTTTFLVMYDIMKNPDVSLEDICRRQYLLGGSNLLLEPTGDDWHARMNRDRAKKIRLFYEFVQGTRTEQIGLPWSDWLKVIKR